MAAMANKFIKSTFLIDIGQDQYMVLGQPKVATWKTDERPAKARQGTFGFNIQTMSLEYYNGSYWLTVAMDKA